MDALIEYGIRWSDLRRLFSSGVLQSQTTTFFYMQIARNINCTANVHRRASERACDAIACAVFADRYLRPRRLDAIRIGNFATKSDNLPWNNAGDSVMIAQKKNDAKRNRKPFFEIASFFIIIGQWSIHLQRWKNNLGIIPHKYRNPPMRKYY